MVGAGAAALAGLIFVAMSIHHKIIIRNATHGNRAISLHGRIAAGESHAASIHIPKSAVPSRARKPSGMPS